MRGSNLRYTVLDRAQEFRTEKIFEGVECDCCEFHSHSKIVRRDWKVGCDRWGFYARSVGVGEIGASIYGTFSTTIVHNPCVGRCKRCRESLAMAPHKFPKAFTRSCPCAVKDCVLLRRHSPAESSMHACMSRDVNAALRNDCDGS